MGGIPACYECRGQPTRGGKPACYGLLYRSRSWMGSYSVRNDVFVLINKKDCSEGIAS